MLRASVDKVRASLLDSNKLEEAAHELAKCLALKEVLGDSLKEGDRVILD